MTPAHGYILPRGNDYLDPVTQKAECIPEHPLRTNQLLAKPWDDFSTQDESGTMAHVGRRVTACFRTGKLRLERWYVIMSMGPGET